MTSTISRDICYELYSLELEIRTTLVLEKHKRTQ